MKDSDSLHRGPDGDENIERGNWTNKTEYILSLIGYAVGLGNIWRFPYLTYKHGGVTFLIAYILMLALCGVPLFFLESAHGQFCSQGPINVWRAVPLFQGLGVAMVLMSVLVTIYCNAIIAYSLYYLFASFQFPLPWASCLSWSDSNCSITLIEKCNVTGVLVANWTQGNITCPPSNIVTVPVQSPSEQYWDRVALQRSSGLDETGPIVWHLALCLLLSIIVVAASLTKGIKSSGKVVYFTTIFPIVVIVVLLIRGVTLEGASNGIQFFIGSISNFSKLSDPELWNDAASQTMFSQSVAFGGIHALSSYNHFHNNMMMDAIVVSAANLGTALVAGIAVFSILGHMAFIYGKPIESVVEEGLSLAFIAYPEALTKLPISPLWSILFFLMLFAIGLDYLFVVIEVISTSLIDALPKLLSSKRSLINIVTCVIIFLLSLTCMTRAGVYWVTLLDHVAGSWLVLVLALLEVIAVSYIYGVNRFIKDIEMMIGKKSFCFWLGWKACWVFFSPCIILLILVWSLSALTPPTYGKVEYPAWGLALGWCMAAFCLIWILVFAVYKLMRAKGSLWQRLRSTCSPSEEWHPYLDIHRGERYAQEELCLKDSWH
ncbi:sodium- and chloride-dependent neutral and basic amino acid transporter B(0+)-like [Genypterus blacodes]|uniref:sodium- and chloride-dependent neutral and basic amino acid transporter B(0+)-like n=1 Tax=Genypterus blacodes TaxID=154954 RepID=UPI003F77272E